MVNEPDRYHRHSVRMKGYDYSQPGAYFVTMVCHGYKCIFGNIVNGVMRFNNLGTIASRCWVEIPDHFPGINVESFVVMPNHIHGIINICDPDCRGTIYRAPTIEKFGQPIAGSIPTIIRTFKAGVSRKAKQELGMVKIWQRNYYEHIIRNELELDNISKYIYNNPETWADDPENHQ